MIANLSPETGIQITSNLYQLDFVFCLILILIILTIDSKNFFRVNKFSIAQIKVFLPKFESSQTIIICSQSLTVTLSYKTCQFDNVQFIIVE